MDSDNQRYIWTLGGLGVCAASLWFLIVDLSSADSAYNHAASNASVKYERDAEAYIKERCFSPSGLREVDCVSKADEAAREGQRKEQELAAQNITAWWTKVMGIAALIGMALSAIGVWLVKTTFDETKKSNDIAEAAHRMERRPYIYMDKADYQRKSQEICTFIVNLKNYGASPAHNLSFKIEVMFGDREAGPSREDSGDASAPCVVAPGQITAQGVDAETFGFFEEFVLAGEAYVYVRFRADYFDAFGIPYYTKGLLYIGGEDFPAKRFRHHTFGNEAT